MTLPPFLRASTAGALLSIKLQPRSTKPGIGDVLGNELKVAVSAAPVDGRANEAVLDLLAEELGCKRSALGLARGHSSRHKLILVSGISAEEVAARLLQARH
jgi:uncharacterized protein (TIGR00251 family)